MKAFVFGNKTFGGHEMMALKIISEIVDSGERVLIYTDKCNYAKFAHVERACDFIFIPTSDIKGDVLLGWLNPLIYIYSIFIFFLSLKYKLTEITLVNGSVCGNHTVSLSYILYSRAVKVEIKLYYPMLHNSDELSFTGLRSWSYQKGILRILGTHCKYITIDKIWKDRISGLSSKKINVEIIHNLVSLNNSCKEKPNNFKDDPEIYRVGIIGRVVRYQKGFDLLLEVILHLESKFEGKLEFHIVGDGDYLESFKSTCQNFDNGQFSFIYHGWVQEPWNIISNLNCLLLPSRTEGIPTVVIEAYQLGLNVIAFDIAGVSAILNSNSLIEVFDTKSFARKIIHHSKYRSDLTSFNSDYMNILSSHTRFKEEVFSCYRRGE